MKKTIHILVYMLFFVIGAPKQIHAGTVHDLLDRNNWNIRIDGASSEDYLSEGVFQIIDINADNKNDLVIGAGGTDYNGRSDSGSLYLIYNDLLEDILGTGAVLDLSDSSNYNVRFDGANEEDGLGFGSTNVVDINSNGLPDITTGNWQFDHNGREDSGSVYVIYDSVFNTLMGTGNTVDMADSDNWNIRYDGASDGDYLSDGSLYVADVDENSNPDIIVGSWGSDNNTRADSGSVYVISDSLIDDHTGTGNTVDMADSDNWNIRYDGASDGDYFSYASLTSQDIDNNGKSDIVAGAYGASNNTRADSGSVYVISDSLIDDHTGTGNTVDMADSDNWNIRYDGASDGDYFSYASLTSQDIDNNGKNDILVGSADTDNNSRSGSGSLYLIYDSLIDDHIGTGNTVDMADSDNWNIRYDGAGVDEYLVYADTNHYEAVASLNNDDKEDLLLWSFNPARNDEKGSLYIVYNFPHSISISQSPESSRKDTVEVLGNVIATNSTTNISGVEYSFSDDTEKSWTSCTASDGSFDSTSEKYRCSIPLSDLSEGGNTIYTRAFDVNKSYTVQSSYASASITKDTIAPSTTWTNDHGADISFDLITKNNLYTSEPRPAVEFTRASDLGSGIAKYEVLIQKESRNWQVYVGDIPPSGKKDDIIDSDTVYIAYRDDSIFVYPKEGKLADGAYLWKARVHDRAGNTKDTGERVLRVNTYTANFTGEYFPLTVEGLNGEIQQVANYMYTPYSDPAHHPRFNTPNPTSIIWGIAPTNTKVTLILEKNSVVVFKQETLTNSDSRWGISITDPLPKGTYTMIITGTRHTHDYTQFPLMSLSIL